MSEKEPPNPFDEIQKQLSELFKNSSVKISAHTMDNDDPGDEDDGGKPVIAEPESPDDALEKIIIG